MNTDATHTMPAGSTKPSGEKPLIMIVGIGDLAVHLINQLLASPRTNRLVLAGRDPEMLRRRANLARFAAANIGLHADVSVAPMDLDHIEACAETIRHVSPDIIVMAASLQSWRRITELPKQVFEDLDEAQLGPWLPMHLSLNYNLMRAVRGAGSQAIVVNAAFPDAVNPTLNQVGLSPTIGIGNVANIIPALTYGAASLLGVGPERLRLRLIAQHYFSHYVPRFGDAGNGSYKLTVHWHDTDEMVDVDHRQLFAMLGGPLKRIGGVQGQLLTAASATRIIAGMCADSGVTAHAPGVNGLPGGYPVTVSRAGGTLDLPETVSEQEAIRINEQCQRADGIERIEPDGSVWFVEREMAIMRDMLGYECRKMALADVADHANELAAKFAEFKRKIGWLSAA